MKGILDFLWTLSGGSGSYTGWGKYLMLTFQIIVICSVFRAWVGPFILRKLSKRIRVRRISLRSVRGVYIRMTTMTIRIDRVGLSYHPRTEASRRFSFKVEGLHVEVHEIKPSSALRSPPLLRSLSRLSSLSEISSSPMTSRLWSFYTIVYDSIEPYARPIIRSFFVAFTRLVIKCLPALTQVIDLEVDRALISFTTAPESHIAVRSLILSTTVTFTNLENSTGVQLVHRPNIRHHQTFLSMSHLQNRLVGSAKRVVGRAWGQTRGKANFELKINGVSGFVDSSKWDWSGSTIPIDIDGSHYGVSCFSLVTHPGHRKAICFDVPGSTELVSAFRFGPTNKIVEDHSVSISLKLSSVLIESGLLTSFIDSLKKLRIPSQPPIVQGLAPRRFFRSSTLFSVSSASGRQTIDKKPRFTKFSLLASIDVQIGDIIVQHTLDGSQRSFRGNIRNLNGTLHYGKPKKTLIYKDFLGNSLDSDLRYDTDVLSFTLLAKDLAVLRGGLSSDSPLSRVVSINAIDTQGFATQIAPHMPSPIVLPGDPNSSMLVMKLAISSPQLSERIDIIGDVIDEVRSYNNTKSQAPRQHKSILRFVPRLKIDFVVEDVAACIIPAGSDADSLSSFILSSTQCVMSFSTLFKSFPLAKSRHPDIIEHAHTPLEMESNFTSVLGPAFVTIIPKPFHISSSSKGASGAQRPFNFGDPLLSLSATEIVATGQTLGGQLDFQDCVILDVESTLADVKCVTDALSIELWQPSAIKSLGSLLGTIRAFDPEGRRALGDRPSMNLPPGIKLHIAIGRIGAIVTGRDLNPEEDLDLSRGISLKAGLSIQMCTLFGQNQLNRIPDKFTRTHERQRLNLPDDILIDCMKNVDKYLLRCSIWDMSLRTCLATEYDADQAYVAEEEAEEIKSTEFFWMDWLDLDVLLGGSNDHNNSLEQTVHVSVRVPRIESRIQLIHIYCSFLALSTIQELTTSSTRSNTGTPNKSQSMLRGSCELSVGTIHLFVKFPLQEELGSKFENLVFRVVNPDSVSARLDSLLVWVPSPSERGIWEELLRLRIWKVYTSKVEGQNTKWILEGDGARLRIPFDYIIADLILDLNVFIKSIKHLKVISTKKRFEKMGIPEPEAAKIVPTINFKIHCLSVEAMDDPLETKLGLIWRAGQEAARTRLEREEAFEAKIDAIRASELSQPSTSDQRFTPQHTVSVEDARERLMLVHTMSWVSLHREMRDEQKRKEDAIRRETKGRQYYSADHTEEPLVPLAPPVSNPPLLRLFLSHVLLEIKPAFESSSLSDFLYDLGKGLPRETQYTLLIPLHLEMNIGSSCVTLRDYPLPLVNIVQSSPSDTEAWSIDTDLVIAEELGENDCVVWKKCLVVPADNGLSGTHPLFISIPKTTMPVKTYASPIINIRTKQLTEFCWGVSYSAALQDVMRVLDSLSTPPPDPSPSIGFWDKLRLILHWRVELSFAGQVHLNLKGSRNPYSIDGSGAGFAFCWNGNTRMTIGHKNEDQELLQVISDNMLIVIPNFSRRGLDSSFVDSIFSGQNGGPVSLNPGLEGQLNDFKKICAKFSSGIKWGIGLVLERACGLACVKCGGNQACRLFTFRPHYEVTLKSKEETPIENSLEDSFNGFRSSYIHLSTSLISSVRHRASSMKLEPNSFHLSPKTFAHFWSWWDLFDRFLSLPIRQGRIFPNARPPSKKFGKYLATIKYRLAVSQLFISHIYIDESKESWNNGTTDCVGLKALVSRFEADMHQREQEAIVPGLLPNTVKKIRHKPFCAVELKLIEVYLRVLLATFTGSVKSSVESECPPSGTRLRHIKMEPLESSNNLWVDIDDFVETDWRPPKNEPSIYMFPVASCPRFTYFRRTSGNQQHHTHDEGTRTIESSRFEKEDSHICLMGKEPSVHYLQAEIVEKRLRELRQGLYSAKRSNHQSQDEIRLVEKKIDHLECHVRQLRETDHTAFPNGQSGNYANYLMPSDIFCPSDWMEFDNVYQAHCPKFSLNNSSRDILMQYYYCSRARKGFEYHMATRAVKFIRDQAKIFMKMSKVDDKEPRSRHSAGVAAQVAAHALKILTGNENRNSNEAAVINSTNLENFDPLDGWSDAVSLNKTHFCLLLKPQFILRSEASEDSVIILAAAQATLQAYSIMDTANIDDPVSGRVMTRSLAKLTDFQAFSPSSTCSARHDGLPMEVFVDLRAETSDFERLVPQTDAALRYDKFNRLRLRNNATSIESHSVNQANSHLQHQTDLVDIQMPRFTVSADSKNFESIANVITDLLLHSDSVHKLHLNKVETLLFRYDFTDLSSAADVVEGIQSRLRRAVEYRGVLEATVGDENPDLHLELTKLKEHIFLLSEELNLIFDAIKFVQESQDDKHNDTKLALKVHASSREISWDMIDSYCEMIAKVAVRDVDYTWLSRQDSSTVNSLILGDLQVFDGSPDAEWPEILAKYREPSNHPLVKKGIFSQADWTILAPVGGITIYEQFIIELHPMRLQLGEKIGRRIMEYVWPARRNRKRVENTLSKKSQEISNQDDRSVETSVQLPSTSITVTRASLDSPNVLRRGKRFSAEGSRPALQRRITSSRSFTDLRSAARQESTPLKPTGSQDLLAINKLSALDLVFDQSRFVSAPQSMEETQIKTEDDAVEMKTRSAQKTFILVRISSMHILLSFHKDGSFFCRDARIQTRELLYRNQTWSFEELADQFIPSDTSWRGWMKMALHQPLVPVLPVARELISKTKWIATKGKVARQARKITAPIDRSKISSDSQRNSEQSNEAEGSIR